MNKFKKKTENDDSTKKEKSPDMKKWGAIAIIILLLLILLFPKKDDKEPVTDTSKTSEAVEQEFTDKDINSVIADSITDSSQTEPQTDDLSNLTNQTDYADETLTINRMQEDVLTYVGNDEELLKTSIREWMNGYGLAEAKAVNFYGEVLIDYNSNTVTLTFTVDGSNSLGFDAVYDVTNKKYNIVSW